MPIDLSPEDRKEIIRFCKFFAPEAAVYVFGSRVKGASHPGSDVDILLMADDAIPWTQTRQLKDALDNSDLLFRVDVTDWHRVNATLQTLWKEEALHIETERSLSQSL